MYAINPFDLSAHRDDFCLQILLAPVIQESRAAVCNRQRYDGVGQILNCNNEQAAAIIKIIRLHYTKFQLRCYQGKNKTWKRI